MVDIKQNNFLDCFIKNLFSVSKRLVSYSLLLQERITRIPVKFSLKIRLIESSDICCFSLIGEDIFAAIITPPTTNGTVANTINDKLSDV